MKDTINQELTSRVRDLKRQIKLRDTPLASRTLFIQGNIMIQAIYSAHSQGIYYLARKIKSMDNLDIIPGTEQTFKTQKGVVEYAYGLYKEAIKNNEIEVL